MFNRSGHGRVYRNAFQTSGVSGTGSYFKVVVVVVVCFKPISSLLKPYNVFTMRLKTLRNEEKVTEKHHQSK